MGPEFERQEQDRNLESLGHNDGVVFRMIPKSDTWRQAWYSKQSVKDLKGLLARPQLDLALQSLSPFVGLWGSFHRGSIQRYLRLNCDRVSQTTTFTIYTNARIGAGEVSQSYQNYMGGNHWKRPAPLQQHR